MAKTTKAKPAKPKKSSPKPLVWLIIGVVVIVVALLVVIVIVAISAKNDYGYSDDHAQENLVVENGKGEEIKTEYYQLDDKKVLVKIPTEFHTLTSTEINKKYSGEVPDVVFANADNDVNIAISLSDSEVKNDQIKQYLDVMRELLESSNEILGTDYYEVSKHNVASIKVATTGENESFYNHMMFFSYDDKLVVVAFNCDLELRSDWERVGDFILGSLYFEK